MMNPQFLFDIEDFRIVKYSQNSTFDREHEIVDFYLLIQPVKLKSKIGLHCHEISTNRIEFDIKLWPIGDGPIDTGPMFH